MYRALRAVVFCLALLMSAAHTHAATPAVPVLRRETLDVRTPLGVFRFNKLMVRYEGSTLSISGTVTNATERDWRHAVFAVALFDDSGRQIQIKPAKPDRRNSSTRLAMAAFQPSRNRRSQPPVIELVINDIPVGKTRYFHQEEIRVQRHVQPANLSIAPDDASQPEYRYVLIEPDTVFPWSYDDDIAGFVFRPSMSRIGFTLENFTSDPLTVDWEKSAYIDPSGVSHRIIHKGVRLVERAEVQPPTIIKPGAQIDEQVYPSDAVEWVESLRYWQEPALFPATGSEGKTFSLSLRVNSAAGFSKDYVFRFRIE